MEKNKFVESKIFNVNGTQIPTVWKPVIFLAARQRAVGAAIYWEQGRNVSVLCEVNASCTFIPSVLVYTRSQMFPQFGKDGPVGTIFQCFKNNWINFQTSWTV